MLEEVIHSHPDGVKDRTVISGKSGNCILLYADGYYITGYNNRIGGYDYVAFEVDNVDDWQIGDWVEITHSGKIRYSDQPQGKLMAIAKTEEKKITLGSSKLPRVCCLNCYAAE